MPAEVSDLTHLTQKELIEKIHNLQKQCQILRSRCENLQSIPHSSNKRKKAMDYSRFARRTVALKISYLGWDYSGLARQELNKSTISEKLMQAFEKCNLLENRDTCSFGVCGRTDKGVSALSQVVTMVLRSNVHSGIGVIPAKDPLNRYPEKLEVDYVYIGNKNLPPDIRILAWSPVPPEFSARHSCISRTYKYYFPLGGLNIELMRRAAQKLVGTHDFRNFCTSQVSNGVINHIRTIISVDVDSMDPGKLDSSLRDMYCISVCGTSFLYHQIRCIVSILLAVGRELESPEIVDHLVDVQATPRKPQYQMAVAEPLLFYEPEFEGLDWQTSPVARQEIVRHLQKEWTIHRIRSELINTVLCRVENDMFPEIEENNYIFGISREAPYGPSPNRKSILKRSTEDSIEEKIKNYEMKRLCKEGKHAVEESSLSVAVRSSI